MAHLEHVGVAVEDVEKAVEVLSDLLGERCYQTETLAKDAIRTHFIWGGSTKLELLEALHDRSAISRYLERRGPGIHHLAFEVEDVEATFQRAKEAGYEPLDPAPRSGADGKLIFFLHPKHTTGILLEFCETVRPSLQPLDLSSSTTLARAACAPGSVGRIPCVYICGPVPAIDPDVLAARIVPGRTLFAAEARSPVSAVDVLDALDQDAAHVIVDAGTDVSLARADGDDRAALAVFLDPAEDAVARARDIHPYLLVLTCSDVTGLQLASLLRSQYPALGLAVSSDDAERTAIIANYLEKDPR